MMLLSAVNAATTLAIGGRGTVDGKECDECESAYEQYFKGMKDKL